MRLIDTSVVSPTVGYPGLANNTHAQVGLDFLQQAVLDMANAFALALLPTGYTPGQAFVIYGCAQVGSAINGGAVWYNGEVFLVPPSTIIGSTNTYIGAAVIANATDTGSNKTVLSDGSSVSMHNQRTVAFEYNSLPNHGVPTLANLITLPDYGAWNTSIAVLSLQEQVVALQAEIVSNMTTLSSEITTINNDITTINARTNHQNIQVGFNYPFISAVPVLPSPPSVMTDGYTSSTWTTPSDGITRQYMIVAKCRADAPTNNACRAFFYLYIGGVQQDTAVLCFNPNSGGVSIMSSLCYSGLIPPGTIVSIQSNLDTANSNANITLSALTFSIAEV